MDKDVNAIELKPAWRGGDFQNLTISESIKSNQVGGWAMSSFDFSLAFNFTVFPSLFIQSEKVSNVRMRDS